MERLTTMTIVRPPATGWEAFIDTGMHEITNETIPVRYEERNDEWLDDVKSCARRIADERGVHLSLYEWQLSRSTPDAGRVARTKFSDSDVIATINPTNIVIGYISSMVQRHPTMRAIIGFDSLDAIESHIEAIGALELVLLRKTHAGIERTCIRRMHAVLRKDNASLRRSLLACLVPEEAPSKPFSRDWGITPPDLRPI